MKKETNIFLVRHGETEWNLQQKLQGNQDSPLTPNGIQQAQEAKAALEPYSIDHAYVSPLQRARDTMTIVLEERSLAPIVSKNLREIHLGPWEGKTRKETASTHPDQYLAFWEKPNLFNLPGAETFQQLQHRMIQELETIFVKHEGYNILVVSHWIAIKVVLAHYSATPLSNLSEIADPINGGFYRLSRKGGTVSIQ